VELVIIVSLKVKKDFISGEMDTIRLQIEEKNNTIISRNQAIQKEINIEINIEMILMSWSL
jgi:hypothetical protein